MSGKQTMTLNLPQAEMAYIEARAAECEMSKTAVVRQAIRLYQLVNIRLAAGETLSFSGDRERLALFIGPGFETSLQPQGDDHAR